MYVMYTPLYVTYTPQLAYLYYMKEIITEPVGGVSSPSCGVYVTLIDLWQNLRYVIRHVGNPIFVYLHILWARGVAVDKTTRDS